MLMVFFIDPMSFNNLAIYDYSLLSNFNNVSGYFFSSHKYEGKKPNNFIIKPIYRYNDLSGVFKGVSYIYSQIILFFYILVKQPKVIHCQWIKVPFFDYYFYKIIKLIFPKIKFVHTAHNLLPHNSGMHYYSIYKKYYNLSDKIIVHHLTTKNELIKDFSIKDFKIEVINHGILENNFVIDFEDKNNKHILKNWEASSDHFVIGFLGNIQIYKGIDLLVDTWIEKAEKFNKKKVKMIIAGEGFIPRLDEIQNNIDILVVNKHLTDYEFYYLLNRCDCIILPYKNISQSGLLFTVINYNKPVIVSNVGGITEPLNYGNIGEILMDYSTEGLFSKIELVISNSKLGIYSIDEFEKVKEVYSWSKISCKTESAYYNI